MLYSKLFGKTVREAPKDATLISHKILYQAGYIRELSSGRYMLTPLGFRVEKKVIQIIDEEMEKIGSQRLIVPTFHPLELWQATHRDEVWGEGLSQVTDRRGAKFAVGATAEAVMVEFVKKFHPSWRDLPIVIHQFSNKFRDELRARGGLLRAREFVMKDAYSFAGDEESFMQTYWDQYHAYEKIAERLGIKAVPVEADSGALGGDFCHEFIVPCDFGEDTTLSCECGYSANKDKAVFVKEDHNSKEKELPLGEISAVRGTTMEDGAKLHGKPLWQQIKDVMFVDGKGNYILAIIRGDYDVNETKLIKLVGAGELKLADDNEIRHKLLSEPGFISPVGIRDRLTSGVSITIVADESLVGLKNAYGGSNKKYVDLINVNFGRDYSSDILGDIADAKEGYICGKCRQRKLKAQKGIEFGHVFKYDDFYTKAMGCTFTDKDGKEKYLQMGAYGIGVGRAIAILAELYHDEQGLMWPKAVSPYQAHLIALRGSEDVAQRVYEKLLAKGIEVLYDDREDVSAGVKFSDADLIGVPVRLVVSSKTGSKVEYKERSKDEVRLLDLEDVFITLLQ